MSVPSFFIIVTLLIATCGSNQRISDQQIYEKAVSQIKKNKAVIDYSTSVLNKPDFQILVSKERIPFYLNTVEIDVIKSNYIEGFDPFGNHSSKELSIIGKVNDSLLQRDQHLNQDFKSENVEDVREENLVEVDYVLFFSEVKEKEVYAQLIPYNYEIYKDSKYESISYGKAFAFLFKLGDQSDIVNVYSNEVSLN